MSIRPCAHPRCRDQDGNPRLTTQNICDPCRRHLRRQLDWLRDDYVFIKAFMPRPAANDTSGRTVRLSFGHPSEWASDTCWTIAKALNRIEDDLREELGDEPPANVHTARETEVVIRAHRYLANRFHDLCDRDPEIAEDAAVTIHELRSLIRRTLGYNRERQKLDGIACPTCDVAALVRSTGQVDCENCGRIITEDRYPLLTRIILNEKLDDLIDAYDATHGTPTDGGDCAHGVTLSH